MFLNKIAVLSAALVVSACGVSSPERDALGESQLAFTFAPSQVFDTTTSLSANEQRSSDPTVLVDDEGTIWVTGVSIPRDPLMTEGGNLWKSTDGGSTWDFLGNAFNHALGFEPHMMFDHLGRLWMAETVYPPELFPVYRFDSPATITSRETGWTQKSFGNGGDRPWLSHYGDRIHFQLNEGMLVPVVRISTNGSANPPVFSPSIPITTDLSLLASIASLNVTGIGTPVVGIAQGELQVDPTTGRMCAPLFVANGTIVNYMPARSIWTACSNDGFTWTNTLVYQAAPGVSVMNFWPQAAIDDAGNMYFLFAANMDASGGLITGMNTFLLSSEDSGLTWSAPKKINSGGGTNLFPVGVGACDGGLNVVWYGTDTEGAPSTLGSNTEWRVYLAQTNDATAASPTWTQTDVAGRVIHYGAINNQGSFGSTDTRMFAFPGLTLDADNNAHVVWTDTGTEPYATRLLANPLTAYMGNPAFGKLYHAVQTGGPTLTCE